MPRVQHLAEGGVVAHGMIRAADVFQLLNT